jgi:biotin synthase
MTNNKQIFLCAINNILSGTCQEDCKFCTQSVRYHADIERYSYKDISTIVKEAKLAKEHGALGYCLVTAGKGLDDKKVDFVARAAQAVKAEVEGLNLIACNGTATKEQLLYLKKHGIDSYNHNLETSERYYADICQTHAWSERYETCENVKSIGLALEALTIINKARTLLGKDTLLMVAGGRELLFSGQENKMFEAGANAIVIGNYLTTAGLEPNKDKSMLDSLGYEVATSCDTQ